MLHEINQTKVRVNCFPITNILRMAFLYGIGMTLSENILDLVNIFCFLKLLRLMNGTV